MSIIGGHDVTERLEAKNVITPRAFNEEIEHIVLDTKFNYIDAIVFFCDKNNIEIASVKELVSISIKQKLEYEFSVLHYLPKKPELF